MDRALPKRFWTQQRLILSAGGILIVGLIAYVTVFADKRSKLNVEREKITVSPVTIGPFEEFIVVTGVVQPLKTIRLDAIEGGYVTQKLVEGGVRVEQGQVLLKLENQSLKLSFLQSETEANRLVNDLQNTRQRLRVERFALRKNLADLEAQLDQAKDTYDRQAKLFQDKVVSEEEYLKAKRTYERLAKQREIEAESQKYQEQNSKLQIQQLEGTLARTQRNVALWQETLSNLVVKAPVSGQLSNIDVEVGSNINRGQNIGQIDDLNGFKMRVGVDEHYNSRIFDGLKGSFDYNNQQHELEITRVYPESRNGRIDVDMRFLKDAPTGLKRGQSSPIRLELGKAAKATLLPVGGFFSDTGGNWVYVLDNSGKRATKRNITLGRKNPEFYEVLEGLQPGEQVITSSYENFGDNEVLEF
jgi:HlyD family secretion protein